MLLGMAGVGTSRLVGELLGLRLLVALIAWILSSAKHPYPAIFLGLTLVPNGRVLNGLVLVALVRSELGICNSLGGYFSEDERGSTHGHNSHPKSFIKVRLSRRNKEMQHSAPIL